MTLEELKSNLEESCIREASLQSPSLGEWMKRYIEEHGNEVQDVSSMFGELKAFFDKEIVFFKEVFEKNGL
ncbi:hypothetical protein EVB55_164 [Rhizobium phage RHph_Y68]|uniref:Uncharacterized protein n=1 Tax=Rhizobium phage RHph_Y68 TaxID=2509787 RepID=A0A7S5R9P1_9CAUD|nr:hypothetical protein PP934_gp164 [Rhizobium phage RHph_Y68]QIG68099.1 hypothetical protein EVB55_164 [Rhizobium phage RHph_Y68]